ncbi:DUF4189 domain-containing protein [Stenotrophomonas maltophilia]|nr:DUF4189 domain-containing protein [Stenotrophomonas maltophilia]NMT73657.1 DUF4189 domain-containing protein [Stenotrophomonas maltophilia]
MKCGLAGVLVAAAAGFVGGISSAHAEGNCPPGMYPIGGQGVQGCAPIPGSSGTSMTPSAPAPAPAGEWVKTWGAIAVSKATSEAGVSTGMRSRRAAEKEALSKCGISGAPDCSLNMTYFNQCVSWAIPAGRSGRGQSGIGSGPTPGAALETARSLCRNDQPGGCDEVYADCTQPVFDRY